MSTVRSVAQLTLVVVVCALTGCYYFGPADPCEDEPLPPTDFEFHDCDPPKGSVIILQNHWDELPIRCDVTGATSIIWWLWVEVAGDDYRILATDVPGIQLSGTTLPWEPGIEVGHLRIVATNGVEEESTSWTLRMVEELP
jgi:hypothetical protein